MGVYLLQNMHTEGTFRRISYFPLIQKRYILNKKIKYYPKCTKIIHITCYCYVLNEKKMYFNKMSILVGLF